MKQIRSFVDVQPNSYTISFATNSVFILYSSYAPWCPACQGLKAPWARLANEDRTDDLQIAEVDVTKYPGRFGHTDSNTRQSLYGAV